MKNQPIIHENHEHLKENFTGVLRKQERVELIHETIIERCKVLQAIRTRLFETLEEKHLHARVELLQDMAKLSHGVTACRHAQDVMDETLNELLRHILTAQIALRQFSCC